MKGRILGFEPVDYKKKGTDDVVKGIRIVIAVKNSKVFGEGATEEFISAKSPLFKQHFSEVFSDLDKAIEELIGAEIIIDYEVQKRGASTFTDITEIVINPAEEKAA